MLSEEQVRRLREVPEFKDGPTGFISPNGALDYLQRKYIVNLSRYCDLSRSIMLDCGCHEGWNIFAFLLEGGRMAIGVDTNEVALSVARKFARIMGVDDRVLFCRASVTELPVRDRGVDLLCCIETLEHLDGDADRALVEINRVARQLVLVTTPNKLFPIVAHDTRLPFAHWLPRRWRRTYARLLAREKEEEGSIFLTPFQITRGLADFRLVSKFLGFDSFKDFLGSYPHYLPYMGSGVAGVRDLSKAKRAFYRLVHWAFQQGSFYVLPSLTGIFRRDGS